MRLSIRTKLSFALLVITTVVVAGMYGFMQWSFDRGFLHFVEIRQQERIDDLKARLAEEYFRDGGWQRLRGDKRRWVGILLEDPPEGRDKRHHWFREASDEPTHVWPPHPPKQLDKRRYVPLALRVMLLDADKAIIFGRAELVDRLSLEPIRNGEATVGYLGVQPGPTLNQLVEIQFMEEQAKSFIVIAVVMVLFSGALAFPLAYTLVKPLKRITAASKALAVGRYETRLPVDSGDELGRLAQDFNDLAQALEKAEQARRQWVADISHELRTPLSVLRGELEALQDRVRPLTPEAIDSLYGDVMRLSRLAEDLYQLSMSDLGALSYRKSEVDPVEILADDLKALKGEFRQRGITLKLDNGLNGEVAVHGDADRLSQLFCNLLQNTLRYTEPGGRLEVRAGRKDSSLVLDFQDSAPGVPEAELPRLFDRFYRVEASRSRSLGGAGLGLAICRNIVRAHGGCISARASPLGGLWIRVELPVLS